MQGLHPHGFIGLNRLHPRVLRQLTKSLQRCSLSYLRDHGDGTRFPNDQRKGDFALIFRIGQQINLRIYRLVRLTSVHGKIIERALLEDIAGHMEDKKITGNSHHGFAKDISGLMNQVAFYSKIYDRYENTRPQPTLPAVIKLRF